jgi:uncharacterized damage-inducible protein DinB
MRRYLLFLGLMFVPALAQAQGSGVSSIRPLYEQFRGWLIASAEQMPEAKYSYQPTDEVRTFGQIVGHVANAAYMFCSAALGEENPNSTDFEKVTAKADLVNGVKDAFAYCDKAYQMDDATAAQEVTFFGQKGSRLWVLNFHAMHDAEHYGNFVTDFRLKGMVPPSSQGGM